MLFIEKTQKSTDDIARLLSRHFNVTPTDVSYAGIKDVQGIARQWFSVWLPGVSDVTEDTFGGEGFRVIEHTRNSKKLRRGAIQYNHFDIIVRHLDGDLGLLEQRLQQVCELGVPNYFGPQRFGRRLDNVQRAVDWFERKERIKSRFLRSLLLSAARSFLFNLVLAERIEKNQWNQALAGDVMMLDGSHSVFDCPEVGDDLQQRVVENDVHPTGPLWGSGSLRTTGYVAELELAIANAYPTVVGGLLDNGLKQERRALRIRPASLRWEFSTRDSLRMEFELPAGAYATSVLREIVTNGNPPK